MNHGEHKQGAGTMILLAGVMAVLLLLQGCSLLLRNLLVVAGWPPRQQDSGLDREL